MPVPDPASAPAWAISMAIDFANKASGGNSIDLALLLASVREGALREAAGVCWPGRALDSSRLPTNEFELSQLEWARDRSLAILSLLTTPPREATR